MICPVDLVQMHQLDKVGGGESTDNKYYTWELKRCDVCGRTVKEEYSATLLTPEEAKAEIKTSDWIKDWQKNHPEEAKSDPWQDAYAKEHLGMKIKKCNTCGHDLPLDAFYRREIFGAYKSDCIKCLKEKKTK